MITEVIAPNSKTQQNTKLPCSLTELDYDEKDAGSNPRAAETVWTERTIRISSPLSLTFHHLTSILNSETLLPQTVGLCCSCNTAAVKNPSTALFPIITLTISWFPFLGEMCTSALLVAVKNSECRHHLSAWRAGYPATSEKNSATTKTTVLTESSDRTDKNEMHILSDYQDIGGCQQFFLM